MPNTPGEFVAYCLAHPQDRDGSTWDQKCVALVFRAGGFTESRDSAYRAALATEAAGHKLDTTTSLDNLPVGWFVYFDKAGPDNGHIGMTTGNGQFGSANWRAKGWGTALGLMSIQSYIDSGARYMGASPFFINTTLDLSSTAGLDLTPLETDMPLNDDDKAWLNGMGASIIDQLQRTVGGAVWGEDLAYANGVHGRSKDWLMNMSVQVGAILEKPSSIIDPAKLAAALVAAGLNVTIDSAALVKALDASLSDNFAAIPAAVVVGIKTAL